MIKATLILKRNNGDGAKVPQNAFDNNEWLKINAGEREYHRNAHSF
jgi:hypothetical protein